MTVPYSQAYIRIISNSTTTSSDWAALLDCPCINYVVDVRREGCHIVFHLNELCENLLALRDDGTLCDEQAPTPS